MNIKPINWPLFLISSAVAWAAMPSTIMLNIKLQPIEAVNNVDCMLGIAAQPTLETHMSSVVIATFAAQAISEHP